MHKTSSQNSYFLERMHLGINNDDPIRCPKMNAGHLYPKLPCSVCPHIYWTDGGSVFADVIMSFVRCDWLFLPPSHINLL